MCMACAPYAHHWRVQCEARREDVWWRGGAPTPRRMRQRVVARLTETIIKPSVAFGRRFDEGGLMSNGSFARALLAIVCFMSAGSTTRADDVADFYAGKRVTLLIGYGTGGGYDAYARALARFLSDHIPGKPTIVPTNMPGAGSRGAANYLYNVAPKDGSVIATISQTTPTDQLMGQPGIQFEAQRFNWIGNMVAINNIAMVA